jgi:hypothetical protein
MKRLFALAFGLLFSGTALAQNVSPGVEYFLGPSQGRVWAAPGAYTASTLNTQTGTTYTIVATDFGKVLTFANGAAIAVTLPVATTANFPDGGCFTLVTIGAGTVTVTPTTSTINGQATKDYATNAGGRICRHGTNYLAY